MLVAQKGNPMRHITMHSLCLATILLAATLSGNVQGGDEKGVTYSVISENDFAGVRRSVDVRLNSKSSSQILRSIAWKIKKAESQEYERTFIFYWLPGMKVGSGAWATTHFDSRIGDSDSWPHSGRRGENDPRNCKPVPGHCRRLDGRQTICWCNTNLILRKWENVPGISLQRWQWFDR